MIDRKLIRFQCLVCNYNDFGDENFFVLPVFLVHLVLFYFDLLLGCNVFLSVTYEGHNPKRATVLLSNKLINN